MKRAVALVGHRGLRQLLAETAPSAIRLCPWGWDRQIVRVLREAGVPSGLLPGEARLAAIRAMSHRRWAAERLLTPLRLEPGTVGESQPATGIDDCIDRLCALLGQVLCGVYAGPLGIDMMVVRHEGSLLVHPCVEMNLRATMGHVALRV